MLGCYEPAHIVGISKTTYALATPRRLDWRRDPQRTSTNTDPSDSEPQDPYRRPAGRDRSDRRSARQPVAGVVVPDGTTVFDDEIPGVAKLDPALLGALRQAATDAAYEGVEFVVDSGWRSPEYQEQLLREAVLKYGSEAEAARWVATPNTSMQTCRDLLAKAAAGQ
jgi:LAS superfamily LD-carboxypeptidase LdcB